MRQRWQPTALPFVKWAGGKRWLVETLLALAPPVFERYLEPFVGGGAVALALAHRPMLLNDANADLMAAYGAVRDELPALLAWIDAYRAGHSDEQFFAVRALDPEHLPLVQRAARLIYLNKTCFNGLWRVNRRGEFNTPPGDARDPLLYDHDQIERASQVLQGAHLSADDYAAFLDRHARAGDFIYLDPPYVPAGTYADFKRYTREQFREADQIHLAELYHELVRRGTYPVLSNADTDTTRQLYRHHHVHVVRARRAINHRGDRRGPVPEIVVVPRGRPA
jgi:DNA adenine methylase